MKGERRMIIIDEFYINATLAAIYAAIVLVYLIVKGREGYLWLRRRSAKSVSTSS